MEDSLLDDVKQLLDMGKGDQRVLKQILRACENDEAVSNYERTYIARLAKEHLNQAPASGMVKTPHMIKTQGMAKTAGPATTDAMPVKIRANRDASMGKASAGRTVSSLWTRNTKIAVGLGLGALTIVIISVLSLGPSDDFTGTPTAVEFSLNTDMTSYKMGDIISISGYSPVPGQVEIFIDDGSNLVWSEQVTVKSDGRYSTLAIAGGSGWTNSDTFAISAENGMHSASSSFSFTG